MDKEEFGGFASFRRPRNAHLMGKFIILHKEEYICLKISTALCEVYHACLQLFKLTGQTMFIYLLILNYIMPELTKFQRYRLHCPHKVSKTTISHLCISTGPVSGVLFRLHVQIFLMCISI